MYSMIAGVIWLDFSHSGCRYNLHAGETRPAYFSAQSKSLLLYITTFNSSASTKTRGSGGLNFLGDRQIQSHSPLRGYAPEVSMFVVNPASRRACVRFVQSCINGSPPVITASLPGYSIAFATILSIPTC